MNREIKFRAFDGKQMLYTGMLAKPKHLTQYADKCFGNLRVYHNKAEVWFLETMLPNATKENFDHPTFIPCEAFMQFTGLLDKNKKEIYDGDIIISESGMNTCIVSFGKYMGTLANYPKLASELEMHGWLVTNQNGLTEPLDSSFYNGEVIGNIYENPELLTK